MCVCLNTIEWNVTDSTPEQESIVDYSGRGGTSSGERGRGTWRRGLERRVNAAVAGNDGASSGDNVAVVRRRAGGEKPTRADAGKVPGANDNAIPRASQLDRTPRHRQNVHCHAKRTRG